MIKLRHMHQKFNRLKLLQFTQQNKYKSVKCLFIGRYLIALLVNSNGFRS